MALGSMSMSAAIGWNHPLSPALRFS
jgi:hypothetical protein